MTVQVFPQMLDWIEENKIEYEMVEPTISPVTFQLVPWRIKFKHDTDYTMFMLKWC
jgi:hypothetical protein